MLVKFSRKKKTVSITSSTILLPWLLFVANVRTVTKRGSVGLKKITINSNSNYDVVIINYVTKILITLRIPSILLFTL